MFFCLRRDHYLWYRARSCSSLGVLGEILGTGSVHTGDDDVITLIGLKRHLINGAEALLAENLDFAGVDDFRGRCGINTRGLDSKDEVSTVLHEHAGVEAKDSSLIGLGNISEDHVAHRHEHAVLLGVTGVLNNRDDIGTLLRHVDEVTADTLGELDGVDGTLGADQV